MEKITITVQVAEVKYSFAVEEAEGSVIENAFFGDIVANTLNRHFDNTLSTMNRE